VRLTLLGTGTSFGVPVVGCGCRVCTSEDPRDRRDRSAAILDLPGGRLLVDTPPELRLQLLREGVRQVDGVWITHPHADHLHGLDDLRIFTTRNRSTITAWVAAEHRRQIEERFPYIFDDVRPPKGTTKPEIRVRTLEPGHPVEVLGARLLPLALPHGPLTVYGFRVGELGYVTDAKSLPPEALEALRGVDTLVLNALWWGDPHPTHFNIEEAIEAAREVGARETWLVHLTHRVMHAELEAQLPDGIRPAWDGLALDLQTPSPETR
jgi:phosphoribosyl 1,2-cyclic phosphate phosphodiesterase